MQGSVWDFLFGGGESILKEFFRPSKGSGGMRPQ